MRVFKLWKKMAFVALATAILAGGAISPLLVSAGEQLGQTDFESGAGLPWHIMESGTGEMDFEIKDGQYVITIVNPGGASRGGEDRWDCQFRHRGLKIVAGHQYRVRYELTPSNGGKYYTKIGNLAGDVEIWHNMSNGYDLDGTWDLIWVGANETKKVDLTFTAGQSMDVAEWAFHLGGDGQYTNGDCFPAGTVIRFDNMSLIDLTSDENDYVPVPVWERAGIVTNQVGYFSGSAKKATLINSSTGPIGFDVLDAGGKSVFQGKSVYKGVDPDSDDPVHELDFSALKTPGTYTIKAEDGSVSREFAIDDSVKYSALLYDSLNYFYQNRSGIAVESKYITSGDVNKLARAAGHTSDNATIQQTWGYSGSSGSQDVTGGWYDAGDHGKYVVNGGISLWIMQNQYEAADFLGMASAYADGTMNIPENRNGYPDLLDEARWEMDWMMKMLVKDGDYKDMVYHKVHDQKWTGLALAPADDPQPRIIFPPTTAATLNASACAAQASRLWKGIDDAYSATCLDVAKRTYEAAKKHPSMYAPLEDEEGGGPYGDNDATDEFYWAASELYITTGDAGYLNDMKQSSFYLQVPTALNGGEAVGAYGSFDWGHVAALGDLSICLNEKNVDPGVFTGAVNSVRAAAEEYLAKENAQGYGQPYAASVLGYDNSSEGYIWGSNSLVADNGMVLAYAYMNSGEQRFLDGTISALDYLLGRNPMDISYVTGYGTHTSLYPHHRYWAHQVDEAFPMAPCGVLVGGPNCGLEDPWVQGSGWKAGEIAPAKSYMDHMEAYSVNECTINWNAPLAWLSGFVTGFSKDGIIIGSTGNGSGVQLAEAVAPKEQTAQSDQNTATANPASVTTQAQTTARAQTDNAAQRQADPSVGQKNTSNVPLILAIIFVFLLALAIAFMVFVYKMTKLKQESGKQESIKTESGKQE